MFIVLCNCPPDDALRIARTLVDGQYAACVNLIPGVTSIYSWAGEVCEDTETTLLIKTSRQRMSALRQKILEIHPYSVPEIIASPIEGAASHAPYVKWVKEMTTPPSATPS